VITSTLEAAFFLLGHLLITLILGACAAALGRRLTWRLAYADSLEALFFSTSLGLGVLGSLIFLLGLLRLLYTQVMLALITAVLVVSFRVWRRLIVRLTGRLRSSWIGSRRPWLAFILGLVMVPTLLLALYPPTEWDTTLYHLPYAQAFSEEHRLLFLPDLRFPVFPQLNEMLFVFTFLLADDVATHFVELTAMFLTALGLAAWGGRISSQRSGLWAAALWLGNPLVVWLGTSAYVDAGLTLFVTSALYAWTRWRATQDSHWIVLAGLFAGFAAASKYTGLFFVVLLLVQASFETVRRRRFKPVLAFLLAAVVACGPTYAWIVYLTGNPVFPFYSDLFGADEWNTDLAEDRRISIDQPLPGRAAAVLWLETKRIVTGVDDLVLVPWRAIFHREMFDWQPPLSPFYLILLPILGPLGLFCRNSRWLLITSAAFGLFWLLSLQDLRLLLPALPPMSLALASELDRLTRKHAGRWKPLSGGGVAPVVAAGLVALGPLYAAYKVHENGRLPTSLEQREVYLSHRVVGYDALRWLNQRHGHQYSVYVLFGAELTYYAQGRFWGDLRGPWRYRRILDVFDDGEKLYRELQRMGADHLLILRHESTVTRSDDQSFRNCFTKVLDDQDFDLYQMEPPTCLEASEDRPF
jgi:4-amino-4-deoxy-L-arabinose transferase-like glycosyltransferase